MYVLEMGALKLHRPKITHGIVAPEPKAAKPSDKSRRKAHQNKNKNCLTNPTRPQRLIAFNGEKEISRRSLEEERPK
jgi:hypothetical protein